MDMKTSPIASLNDAGLLKTDALIDEGLALMADSFKAVA